MEIDNKYCCESLKEFSKNRENGFSVYKNERGFFFLKFDCIDAKNFDVFRKIIQRGKKDNDTSINISVSGEIGMRYCPWCGRVLKEEYGV